MFHTDDGEVFAIDDTCTHQDASLADGWLEGCDIECPLHASRFNLRTGAVDAPPAKLPVRTHEVVIVDGVINVVLDDAPPNLPPASPRAWPARQHSEKRCGGGASLAGLSAARALRAQGFDGELTVVGGEARRPYDRPPLSKEFLAGDVGEDALALEADDDDLDAQWLLGVRATASTRPRAPCTRQRNHDPRRRHRRRDGRTGAVVARLGGPRRSARVADHR